jgi:asparagine synthase (glutamine-hydrolysing)
MDSSALVALMSRVSKDQPETFSVVFKDQRFNEASYSRLVAEKFQTNHHEIELGEEQLLLLLPDAVQSFDLPSMDGVNTYVVSGAVKQAGVTVALSGLGGDELFAGYPSFRRALQMNSVPPVTKRLMRKVGAVGKFTAKGDVRRNKLFQLAQCAGNPADVYRISRQLFDPKTILSIFGSSYSEEAPTTITADVVNEISRLEIKGYMSMAHSLEVRVPFVDVNVAGFSLSLPGKIKLNGDSPHVSKPLLAEAISDLLPKEFLGRRKMGFTLPFEKWMQARLKGDISRVLLDHDRLADLGLETESVGKVWQRFLKSPRYVGWSRPWSLYVLAKWCEANRMSR